MSRRKALTERLQRSWRQARLTQWDREDGPGPVLRWSIDHPWAVTVIVAAVLTVVLGATFGIPPVSPLMLVVIVVAPLPLWLRAERRILAEWEASRDT